MTSTSALEAGGGADDRLVGGEGEPRDDDVVDDLVGFGEQQRTVFEAAWLTLGAVARTVASAAAIPHPLANPRRR